MEWFRSAAAQQAGHFHDCIIRKVLDDSFIFNHDNIVRIFI